MDCFSPRTKVSICMQDFQAQPTLVGSPAFQAHLGLPSLLFKQAARDLCAQDGIKGHQEGPGLSASKSPATSHPQRLGHGHTNFQSVGQLISSAGLAGPHTPRPLPSWHIGSCCYHSKSHPIRSMCSVVSLHLNGQFAPGSRAGFSSAGSSRTHSNECPGPRQPGLHHRRGSPHGTAGALPTPNWRAVRVLTGSPGPHSAACIGPGISASFQFLSTSVGPKERKEFR